MQLAPNKPRGRKPTNLAGIEAYNSKIEAYNVWAEENGEALMDYLPLPDAPSYDDNGVKVTVKPAATDKVKVQESEESIVKRVKERFEVLEEVAWSAATGGVRGVIVSGTGGVGKSTTVGDIMTAVAEDFGTKVTYITGVVTPIHLYNLLYENRDENTVIVMDDADSVLEDETSLTILKAALDTKPIRTLSWLAASKVLKEKDCPSSFEYRGTMIFITNIDMQGEIDRGKSKRAQHLEALVTRTCYVDLKLHTAREKCAWIKYIVPEKKILHIQHGLDGEQEQTVLTYITENAPELRNLSIRTATMIGGFLKTNPKTWRKMADVLMKR